MSEHVLMNMDEVISNDYNYNHKAVDIVGASKNSDDVIAFNDGTVEVVVKDVKYTNHNSIGNATYGNFVKIKHDDGTKTLYAHLKYGTVLVDLGQRVSKGQKIGTMGETGNAYGVHLHFEVRDSNDNRMDPKEYLYKKIESVMDEKIESDSSEENLNEEIMENNNVEESDLDNDTDEADEIIGENIDENAEIMISENDFDIESIKNELYEIVKMKNNYNNYVSNLAYHGGSIVDALKEIGIDSSFESRYIIAHKNGIDDYQGTYSQNVHLLKLLKSGILKA